MADQRKRRRGIRRFLKDRSYIFDGHLFFRSKRGFRLLATPRGVSSPELFSEYEKVFVYVTPGWWVRSWLKPGGNLHAIVVPKVFGRFGNQALQLVHSITIAQFLRAGSVICPGNVILTGFRDALSDGTTVIAESGALQKPGFGSFLGGLISSWSPRAHLVGNFFYTTALPVNAVTVSGRSAAFGLVKKVRTMTAHAPALPDDHLVIHLRGGDAFGPNAHNEYGQPPASFYEVVLADRKWSKVTVVTADDVNPVLPLLISQGEKYGVSISIQSGEFEEDLAFLFSARTLASSRTTFIPAITGLSDNAATIYVFGDENRFPSHLAIKRVIDTVGTYWNSTCVYNWSDEGWQRELMMNYPSSNLAFAGS